MNPLRSHWLRLAGWLFLASPIVAVLVVLTSNADFTLVLLVTLYMWALVCVILALIALAGLVARVVGWGIRAFRR
ncbi:MAG: hypothetical protein HY874_04890 [Chloroflexi bacterium]|nr:hypothetical protein [Chloroflexota bacterium]